MSNDETNNEETDKYNPDQYAFYSTSYMLSSLPDSCEVVFQQSQLIALLGLLYDAYATQAVIFNCRSYSLDFLENLKLDAKREEIETVIEIIEKLHAAIKKEEQK